MEVNMITAPSKPVMYIYYIRKDAYVSQIYGIGFIMTAYRVSCSEVWLEEQGGRTARS